MKKIVLAVATFAAVSAVSAPAFAQAPCGSGWKIVGREGAYWVCENLNTGVTRLVGG